MIYKYLYKKLEKCIKKFNELFKYWMNIKQNLKIEIFFYIYNKHRLIHKNYQHIIYLNLE